MVAVVAGGSLGLVLGSTATLGSSGSIGQASLGRSGQGLYVNAATGNLIIQARDELLLGRGPDAAGLRTYNSLGQTTDDNGDNWNPGSARKVWLSSGSPGQAGSTVTRRDEDGSEAVFSWDAAKNLYLSSDGAGAHDTLGYNAGNGQWTYVEGSSRIVEVYASASDSGRILSQSDPSGNILSFAYNGSGLLSSVTTSAGEITYYDYSGNQLTQLRTVTKSSAGGAPGTTLTRVRYGYDGSNRLQTVTVDLSPEDNSVADGKVFTTTYAYDGSSKRVQSIAQTDGVTQSFTYELVGGVYRVKTVQDASGGLLTFTYDTANRRTTVRDALNQDTVYTYDTAGQLREVRTTLDTGAVVASSYTYTAKGDVESITDGEGRAVQMSYDDWGNLLRQSDAAGNVVRRTYNSSNQLLTETVATLGEPASTAPAARYVYDAGGKSLLRFQISAEGRVTEHRYDAQGQRVASIRYALGQYAVAGLASSSVPSETDLTNWAAAQDRTRTERVDYQYDWRGQLSQSTSYANVDAAGSGLLDGGHAVTRYFYAAAGQLLYSYSPKNELTHYSYDGLGRVLTSTNALNQTTVNSYDDANRRVQTTAANGLVSTSLYDALGRLISVQQSGAGAPAQALQASGGISVVGDTATMTGTAGWNEGVSSRYGITGGAVVSFRPVQTDKYLMVGLNTDPTSDNSYPSIDWALYCTAEGSLQVYENGTYIGTFGTYASGDSLSVSYDGTAIRYVRNGVTLRSVTVAITQPLYMDSSFYSLGARVEGLQFKELGQGSRFVNDGGMNIDGSTVTKVGGTANSWDSAIRSKQGYAGGASVSFRPSQANKYLMVGLNADPTRDNDYGSLDWALYCCADGHLYVYENGSNVADLGLYAAGDSLSVSYDGTAIRYFQNGKVLRSVTVSITQPLYVDSSFYSAGAQVTQLSFEPAAFIAASQNVYDADGQLRMTRDATGAAQWYFYDPAGRKVGTVNALGQLQEYVYDRSGKLTQTIDYATPVNTATLVDGAGNPTGLGLASVRPSAGSAYRASWNAYDAAGRLAKTVSALGEVTEFSYDAAGRAITTRQYANTISTAGLGSAPPASSIAPATSSADRIGRNFYGHDGLLLATVDGAGGLVEYRYDAAGRATTRVGHVTAATASQAAAGTMPESAGDSKTLTFYNARGQVVAELDALKVLTEKVYDANGNLAKVLRYPTQPVSVAVDPTTNLETIRTNAGPVLEQASYSYDAINRQLTQRVDPNGLNITTSTTYDDAYNRLTAMDAKGVLTQTQFDERGLAVAVTVDAAPGGLVLQARNAYDTLGRVKTSTDAKGVKTEYGYDLLGRKLMATVDPGGLNLVTTYAYDRQGNLARVIDAKGQHTRYVYDGDNRLVYTLDAEYGLTENRYDAVGNVSQTIRYAEKQGGIQTFDIGGGLISNSFVSIAANAAKDQVTRYAYDAAGRRRFELDAEGAVTEHRYDAAGQVTNTLQYERRLNIAGSLNEAQMVAATSSVVSGFDSGAEGFSGAGGVWEAGRLKMISQPDAGGSWSYVYSPRAMAVGSAFKFDVTPNQLQQGLHVGIEGSGSSGAYNRLAVLLQPDGRVQAQVAGTLSNWLSFDLGAYTAGTTYTVEIVTEKSGATLYFYAKGTSRSQGYVYAAKANEFNWAQLQLFSAAQRYPSLSGQTTAYIDNVEESAPAARTTRYAYDAAGRQIYSVDATGAVTQYEYDAAGQVTAKREFANPIGLPGDGSADGRTVVLAGNNAQVNGANYVSIDTSRTYKVKARVRQLSGQGQVYLGVSTRDVNGTLLTNPYQGTYSYAGGSLTLTPEMGWTVLEGVITGEAAIAAGASYNNFFAGSKTATPLLLYNYYSTGTTDLGSLVEVDSLEFIDVATGATLNTGSQMQAGTAGLSLEWGSVVSGVSGGAVSGLSAAQITERLRPDAARDRLARYAYDAAGRKRFELDAEGAVTEYRYDAAGQVTSTLQYERRLNIAGNLSEVQMATAVSSFATDFGSGLDGFAGAGGVWETGRLKMISRPDAGGSWSYVYSPRTMAVGSGFKFDVTPSQLQQTLHVGVEGASSGGSYNRLAVLLNPDGHVRAQVAGTQSNWLEFDLGTYTAGTTYTVEIVTEKSGATLYFYAKGALRSQGYVYTAKANEFNWAQLRLWSAAQRYPSLSGETTAYIDNVEESAPAARATRHVYDAAGRQIYSVDAAGSVTQYEYDSAGQVTARREYANAAPAAGAMKLWHREGTNRSASKYLGSFQAGDVVTATVRFKSSSNAMGYMFLGDAGGPDAYDNDTGDGAWGNDGWQTITLTQTMSHDDYMWVYIYGDMGSSDDSHFVLYDNVRVSSVKRGDVLVDDFENITYSTTDYFDKANWSISGLSEQVRLSVADAASQAQLAALLPTLADPLRDRTTRYAYDAVGRQIYSVDAAGSVTQFEYDAAGQVTAKREYANAIGLPGDGSADGRTVVLTGNNAQINGANYVSIDTTRTYRVRVRIRQLSGQGGVYLGVSTRDVNGTLLTNPYQGTYSYAGGSLTLTPEMGWTVLEGVITGEAAIAAGASYNNFFAGSKSATPLLLYNYYGNSTTDLGRLIEVDSLEFIDVATGATLNTGAQMQAGTAGLSIEAGIVSGVSGGAASGLSAAQIRERLRPDAARDRVTRYVYDKDGHRVYEQDALGGATKYRYDSSGRVIERIELATRIDTATALTVSAFDTAIGVGSVSDRPTRNVYNTAGQLRFTVNALGGVVETQYDAFGRIARTLAFDTSVTYASITDVSTPEALRALLPASTLSARETFYTYTAGGQLLHTAQSFKREGSVKSFAVTANQYDAFGRVVATRRYANAVTDLQAQDLSGVVGAALLAARLTAVQDAGTDRIDRFEYNAQGRVVKTTDGENYTELFSYDALGNKTRYVNKNGAAFDYTYDGVGRLLSENGPPVDVTTVTKPSGTLQVAVQSGQRIETRNAYDSVGNLVSRTEAYGRPEQRTTRYDYDRLGRQIRTTYEPVGIYDGSVDNLGANGINGSAVYRAEATRALVAETVYNAFGEAIVGRDVAGNYSYKTYDLLGRVVNEVDANHNVTQHLYSAADGDYTQLRRLSTGATFTDGLSVSESAINAAATAAVPSGSRSVYTYLDRLGRTRSVVDLVDGVYSYDSVIGQGGAWARNTTYVYNVWGEVDAKSVQLDSASGSPRLATTGYLYNQRGELTREVDPEGYVTDYWKNAFGENWQLRQYVTRINPAGDLTAYPGDVRPDSSPGAPTFDRITAYRYDRRGMSVVEEQLLVQFGKLQTASTATLSRTWGTLSTAYQYDGVGNLLVTGKSYYENGGGTAVGGGSTSQTYDALGRLRLSVDAGGRATSTEYDALGEVSRSTRHGNLASGGTAPVGHADDQIMLNWRDKLGRVLESRDALGYSRFFSYDAAGHVAKQWTPFSDVQNTALNAVQLFGYDKTGQQTETRTLIQSGGALGGTYSAGLYSSDTAVYNAFGEVTSKYRDGQQYAYYEYDAGGRIWRTNAEDGVDKVFLYDLQDNVTAVITSTGLDLRSYISVMAVPTTAAAGVRRTGRTYDKLKHLVEQRDLGATHLDGSFTALWQRQSVDRWGNVLSTTTSSGCVTNYRYNINNQVIEEQLPTVTYYSDYQHVRNANGSIQTDAAGAAVTARPTTLTYYDAWGRNIGSTDARGKTNAASYKITGELDVEYHADGGQVSHGYDNLGRETWRNSAMWNASGGAANGKVSYYAWDRLNRKTAETVYGRLLMHSNGADSQPGSFGYSYYSLTLASYTYDALGNRTSETSGDDDALRGVVQQYSFDTASRMVRSRNTTSGKTTAYGYNAAGQKTSETDGLGQTGSWAYSASGRLLNHTDIGGAFTTYEYDRAGALTRQSNNRGQDLRYTYFGDGRAKTIQDVWSNSSSSFDYDADGNKTVDRFVSNGVTYRDVAMGYDALGRMASVADRASGAGALQDYALTIQYDAAGNRYRVSGTVRDNDAWEIEDNEMVDHDGLGVRSVDLTYTYDAMNRVTGTRRLTYSSTSNQTVPTTSYLWTYFGYDADGARISEERRLTNGAAAGAVAGRLVNYTYDFAGRVSETFVTTKTSNGAGADVNGTQRAHRKNIFAAAPDAGWTQEWVWAKGTAVDSFSYIDESPDRVFTTATWSNADSLVKQVVGQVRVGSGNWYTTSNQISQLDAAGNLKSLHVDGYQDQSSSLASSLDYAYTYLKMEGYLQRTATVSGTQWNGQSMLPVTAVTTTQDYDVNGQVLQTFDSNTATTTAESYLVTDNAGHIVVKVNNRSALAMNAHAATGTYNPANGAHSTTGTSTAATRPTTPGLYATTTASVSYQTLRYANDQTIGNTSETRSYQRVWVSTENPLMAGDASVAAQAPLDSAGAAQVSGATSGKTRGTEAGVKAATGGSSAPAQPGTNVVGGQGYWDYLSRYSVNSSIDDAFSPANVAAGVGAAIQYVWKAGDTLRGLAQAFYGDANLWYVIAGANGYAEDNDAEVGATLSIPSVTRSSNTAKTFAVYNASRIVGNTNPDPIAPPPPPPPKSGGGCGGLGTILVVVVAVVVTIYTAGAAAAYFGAAGASAAGGTFAAGMGVLGGTVGGGTLAGLGAAAIGGAVGSIASQGAAMAMGMQDSLNWKQVGLGAVGSAVSAGLPAGFGQSLGGVGSVGQVAARAAVSNALTQGVSVAAGLQEKFSWRSVAASAVAAPAAQFISGQLQPGLDKLVDGNAIAMRTTMGIVNGVVSQRVRMLVTKQGKIDYASIAADAFGNALGDSIVAEMQPQPVAGGSGLKVKGSTAASWGPQFNVGEGSALPTSYALGGAGPVRFGGGSVDAQPTAEELQAAFRQSERDYRSSTEQSVAGSGYVAQNGDNISRIVGSSDPQAIGNFMRANGLTSSNIEVGRNYFRPDDVAAYGNGTALGQAVLNNDNARLAALAQERFAFSDGLDARDIRQSFVYRSRVSNELAKIDAQDAYASNLQRLTSGRYMTAAPSTGDPYAQTRANIEMALVGPQVAAAVAIPATVASITAAGAVYSTVGPWGTAGIGFVTAGGMDAGMQYYDSGTVRPAQSLFSGAIGAVSGPVGATSGLWTNVVLGGTGAAVNTGFQNLYYGDDKSLVVPTLVGSGFGAFGYYAGMATTKGLSAFKPEIYYPNLNPQVPALFQPRAINIVPGAVGVSVGGIASGTAPMGENLINSLFPPPPKR